MTGKHGTVGKPSRHIPLTGMARVFNSFGKDEPTIHLLLELEVDAKLQNLHREATPGAMSIEDLSTLLEGPLRRLVRYYPFNSYIKESTFHGYPTDWGVPDAPEVDERLAQIVKEQSDLIHLNLENRESAYNRVFWA